MPILYWVQYKGCNIFTELYAVGSIFLSCHQEIRGSKACATWKECGISTFPWRRHIYKVLFWRPGNSQCYKNLSNSTFSSQSLVASAKHLSKCRQHLISYTSTGIMIKMKLNSNDMGYATRVIEIPTPHCPHPSGLGSIGVGISIPCTHCITLNRLSFSFSFLNIWGYIRI